MRIGCLQFAPQVGDVNNNLNRADAVLSKANPKDIDLLVLPELAFSGYNFQSLQHISPYLEPTTAGISSLWARTTALKYDCVVTVGYPEKVDIAYKWPSSPEYYNSAITVNRDGETVANYRKSFLYYTDETWALEGPDGFFDGDISGLGSVAMGICMDLNPYKFEAPWSAWEFAYHILHRQANLVIMSMAWLTREDARAYSRTPKEPDMETLSYWIARLEPVIRAESRGEIIVVLANRCGTEEDAVYAGTSAVLGIEDGEVKLYGVLGRGERELLVVDTDKAPVAKLIATSTASSPIDEDTIIDVPEKHLSIDEIMCPVVPLSPVEIHTSHQFFDPTPLTQDERAVLKSSVTRKDTPIARDGTPGLEDCTTFERPFSPKSRNASRTRDPVYQEPALVFHDLANEPKIHRIEERSASRNHTARNPHSAGDTEQPQPWDQDRGFLRPDSRWATDFERPKSTGW